MCRKPFSKNGASFGCGQCMHCRFNRRRIWTHRIMLEAVVHSTASFVTLTYSDEKLPYGGTLVPRDLCLFLKRLRRRLSVRYYAVGEYGDESWRPHYHLALFGAPVCERGRTEHRAKFCCAVCAGLVADWGKGGVDVGNLTVESAQYIAGYINKKMTSVKDERLSGKYPEFARMSLRPGIGAVSISSIADAIRDRSLDDFGGDVPQVLRHRGRDLPLGRYMRSKLREELGVTGDMGKAQAFKKSAELLVMRQNYLLDAAGGSFASLMEAKAKQKMLNREVRAGIFAKRKDVL